MADPVYDPRFLAGVALFNQREFFEAHEVWEALWLSADVGDDRRFVQSLIQAAVALYHFGNANARGASKLFHSGRAYMQTYPVPHLGMDGGAFWQQMELCLQPVLAAHDATVGATPDESLFPTIDLSPPPTEWPDPTQFLDEDH
jgi:hypothetical protein